MVPSRLLGDCDGLVDCRIGVASRRYELGGAILALACNHTAAVVLPHSNLYSVQTNALGMEQHWSTDRVFHSGEVSPTCRRYADCGSHYDWRFRQRRER